MYKYKLLYTGYFVKVNKSYIPEPESWKLTSDVNGVQTYTSEDEDDNVIEMKFFNKEAALKYIKEQYEDFIAYAERLRLDNLKTVNS